MSLIVLATCEGGVHKPAEPRPLAEHEQVRVTLEAWANRIPETAGSLPWRGTPEELQRFAEDPELDYHPPPEGQWPSRICCPGKRCSWTRTPWCTASPPKPALGHPATGSWLSPGHAFHRGDPCRAGPPCLA
jgi:hypothetical protein